METNNVTQVGQAIAKMLNSAGNTVDPMYVQGKAPKGKAEVKTKEQKEDDRFVASLNQTMSDLEDVLTAKQLDIVQAIGMDAWKRQAENDAWDVAFAARCAALHPSGKVMHECYAPIIAALRAHFGQYPATCYRNAVRAMHKRTFGDAPPAWLLNYLPHAQDKRGTGNPKVSPGKWYRGVQSAVGDMADRLNRCPKHNVDPKALAAFTAALKALNTAEAALGKAIKRQANA